VQGGAQVALASARAARPAGLSERRAARQARAGKAGGRRELSGERIIGAVPMRGRGAAWVRTDRWRSRRRRLVYSSSAISG
jgi:hypothetical protein